MSDYQIEAVVEKQRATIDLQQQLIKQQQHLLTAQVLRHKGDGLSGLAKGIGYAVMGVGVVGLSMFVMFLIANDLNSPKDGHSSRLKTEQSKPTVSRSQEKTKPNAVNPTPAAIPVTDKVEKQVPAKEEDDETAGLHPLEQSPFRNSPPAHYQISLYTTNEGR